MKKILCFLFLALIAVSYKTFSYTPLEELINANCVRSIKAIVDAKDCDYSGIFNGNKKIVELENFSKLHTINYDGITIIVDKKLFNIGKLFDTFNIIIVNKYAIGDNSVYDCQIGNNVLNNFNSMQIVERKADIVIGFPMILNDF